MSLDQWIAIALLSGSIAWALFALIAFWLTERE